MCSNDTHKYVLSIVRIEYMYSHRGVFPMATAPPANSWNPNCSRRSLFFHTSTLCELDKRIPEDDCIELCF